MQGPDQHAERILRRAVHQESVRRPVGLLGEHCGVEAAEAFQSRKHDILLVKKQMHVSVGIRDY